MTPDIERAASARARLSRRCIDDVADFLDVDWGRRARVCAGPDRAGFDDLLTLDGVDRALTTTALRTPFFRLVRAGERIAPSAYTRSGRAGSRPVDGIVDPVAVASLFEQGATIVLQAMHRWSEPVARFCRELEVELGFPCQVNAYVTPAGAQGLDLHHDPHDVFVLQAFGRKRWEVHAAPGEAAAAAVGGRTGRRRHDLHARRYAPRRVRPGSGLGAPHRGGARRRMARCRRRRVGLGGRARALARRSVAARMASARPR